MEKPKNVEGRYETFRWYLRQMWRDLLSVYYANTPVWRWLKSGALMFLGMFVWAGASVLLSIRPEWTFLYLVMAYGFLLILWGPLTHFAIVPTVLKLRRTAEHPVTRTIARHGGKINLTIFLTLVIVLAVWPPAIMLLEFEAALPGDGAGASGDLQCVGPEDDVVTCEVHDAQNIDHVVVMVGGDVVAEAHEPPFRVEVRTDQLRETRTGYEFAVEYRDEDGNTLQRQIRTVHDS